MYKYTGLFVESLRSVGFQMDFRTGRQDDVRRGMVVMDEVIGDPPWSIVCLGLGDPYTAGVP